MKRTCLMENTPKDSKIVESKEQSKEEKPANILVQMFIFTAILMFSFLVETLLKPYFPLPASMVGLVLLFLLLEFKIVKVNQVNQMGMFFISIIGFLFVPSGISLAKDLSQFQSKGLQLMIVIIISTIIMLLSIAYTAKFFIFLKKKFTKEGAK